MSGAGFRKCIPDVGTTRRSELATGDNNCDNLNYSVSTPFQPGTLEVYNDGVRLYPNEFVEGLDGLSFSIVLTPNSSQFISEPTDLSEQLLVSYTEI